MEGRRENMFLKSVTKSNLEPPPHFIINKDEILQSVADMGLVWDKKTKNTNTK